jgi:hypothetical protein
MRALILSFLGMALMHGGSSAGFAASVIEVQSITVVPHAPTPGETTSITARIGRSRDSLSQEPLAVNVIAAVTFPDKVTKSTIWKKETFGRRESKDYDLSRLIGTSQPGSYKVDLNVYSADMRRRLARRTMTFTVSAKMQQHPGQDRMILGIGAVGNALNPSGGGTVLLWPHDRIGLQGSYTVGTFTFTEARLLIRFRNQGSVRPYIGVGYLEATRKTDVIGVNTEFKDSGISGAIGAEIPLARRLFGYVEAGGSSIKLEKVVTNGTDTVTATVDYAPVTISAGIVLYLF